MYSDVAALLHTKQSMHGGLAMCQDTETPLLRAGDGTIPKSSGPPGVSFLFLPV